MLVSQTYTQGLYPAMPVLIPPLESALTSNIKNFLLYNHFNTYLPLCPCWDILLISPVMIVTSYWVQWDEECQGRLPGLSRGKPLPLPQSAEAQSSPDPIPKPLEWDFYQSIGFLILLAKCRRVHTALGGQTSAQSEGVCPASSSWVPIKTWMWAGMPCWRNLSLRVSVREHF